MLLSLWTFFRNRVDVVISVDSWLPIVSQVLIFVTRLLVHQELSRVYQHEKVLSASVVSKLITITKQTCVKVRL